jgi:hypothetical protein
LFNRILLYTVTKRKYVGVFVRIVRHTSSDSNVPIATIIITPTKAAIAWQQLNNWGSKQNNHKNR